MPKIIYMCKKRKHPLNVYDVNVDAWSGSTVRLYDVNVHMYLHEAE